MQEGKFISLLIIQHFILPKLSDLSKEKNRFTQVNPDLEIVAIHQNCDFY